MNSQESEMKFIVWDPKDGRPNRDDDGNINSSGLMGPTTLDNVYLSTYGAKPDGSKEYQDLEVGECVRGVKFSLSGSKGIYDIYRVK